MNIPTEYICMAGRDYRKRQNCKFYPQLSNDKVTVKFIDECRNSMRVSSKCIGAKCGKYQKR